MDRNEIDWLLLRARGLAVLGGVLGSPAARDLLALLGLLAAEAPDPTSVARTFGRLWGELAAEPDPILADAWRAHLVARLLDDENPFSLSAERRDTEGPSGALVEQTRRELSTLQELFDLDAETLLGLVEGKAPELAGIWIPWNYSGRAGEDCARSAIARKLAAARGWGDCAGLLEEHFARHGAGTFGRYRAFRWRGDCLRAVARPDPVRLGGLVGYEREREPLLRNTERFIAGLPAHHALLYGPPGTGKSSTVKAILNEYADEGLRLVEVAKGELAELPQVLEVLRARGGRFILFVDDLSFEEHEVEYKALKALLEGSVEGPPENVRLYATSNRRNLIRENFSDRGDGVASAGLAGDDVHARDTMQEKLSLVARFGLRLTFPSPDQQRYLDMVAGLVRERGIEIPAEDLPKRALLWDRWHAGRSGRTARQFVDELEAELAEGANYTF